MCNINSYDNEYEEFLEEKHYRCRICGMKYPAVMWYPDGSGSFGICHACGCESGYEDDTVESARNYRKTWIAEGMPWNWKLTPCDPIPDDWNPKENLKNIPKEYL